MGKYKVTTEDGTFIVTTDDNAPARSQGREPTGIGYDPITNAVQGGLTGFIKGATGVVTRPADLIYRGANAALDYAGADPMTPKSYAKYAPSNVLNSALDTFAGKRNQTAENIGELTGTLAGFSKVPSAVPGAIRAGKAAGLALPERMALTGGAAVPEGAAWGAAYGASDPNKSLFQSAANTGAATAIGAPLVGEALPQAAASIYNRWKNPGIAMAQDIAGGLQTSSGGVGINNAPRIGQAANTVSQGINRNNEAAIAAARNTRDTVFNAHEGDPVSVTGVANQMRQSVDAKYALGLQPDPLVDDTINLVAKFERESKFTSPATEGTLPDVGVSSTPGEGLVTDTGMTSNHERVAQIHNDINARIGASSGVTQGRLLQARTAFENAMAENYTNAGRSDVWDASMGFKNAIRDTSEKFSQGAPDKVAAIAENPDQRISVFGQKAIQDAKTALQLKTSLMGDPNLERIAQVSILQRMLNSDPAGWSNWLQTPPERADALMEWFGPQGLNSLKTWATQSAAKLTSPGNGTYSVLQPIKTAQSLGYALANSTRNVEQAQSILKGASIGLPSDLEKLNRALPNGSDWGAALTNLFGVTGGAIAAQQMYNMGGDPNNLLQKQMIGQQATPPPQLPLSWDAIKNSQTHRPVFNMLASELHLAPSPAYAEELPDEAGKQMLAQMQQARPILPGAFQAPPSGYQSYANGKLNSPMDQALHMQAAVDLPVPERARVMSALWDGGKYSPLPGGGASSNMNTQTVGTTPVDPMQMLMRLGDTPPRQEQDVPGLDTSLGSETKNMLAELHKAQAVHGLSV